jgi:hypothetical protein
MYWETKTREQQHQMDILAKDAARVDAALKQMDEQVLVGLCIEFRR